MHHKAGQCSKTSTLYAIFIVTPSQEEWPIKPNKVPSLHEKAFCLLRKKCGISFPSLTNISLRQVQVKSSLMEWIIRMKGYHLLWNLFSLTKEALIYFHVLLRYIKPKI